MAWNPSPKVADCRDIARKWKKECVIIITIDSQGQIEMATYGEDKDKCNCARDLGNTAFDAIERRKKRAEEIIALQDRTEKC